MRSQRRAATPPISRRVFSFLGRFFQPSSASLAAGQSLQARETHCGHKWSRSGTGLPKITLNAAFQFKLESCFHGSRAGNSHAGCPVSRSARVLSALVVRQFSSTLFYEKSRRLEYRALPKCSCALNGHAPDGRRFRDLVHYSATRTPRMKWWLHFRNRVSVCYTGVYGVRSSLEGRAEHSWISTQ